MRKILAFILSVAIILGTVPVFAAGEAVSFVNSGENISFMTNFGIIEDVPADGNAPVNRIEFARMFYRILISKNIPDYTDYNVTFYDVKQGDAEVVRTVSVLGIMNGVGNNMFGSETYVTYAQAVKAMVSFLGYNVKAEALGGWPTGYWSTAISLKLLSNPPSDFNARITYNGVAELFRYAAEASIMESYGNDTYTVEDGDTYITCYYDIVRNSAIITANSITNFEGEALSYGQIAANGITMYLTENTASLEDYIGYSVELFCQKSGSKYEVIHYELNENNITVINSSDINSASYNEYVYENENGKQKTVKLDSRATVVYNNTTALNFDLTTLNPFASNLYDGTVKCVDNNGDNKADIIFVDCYETMVVGSVKDGLVFSKIRFGNSIDTNIFEENSVNVLNVAGQPINPSEIAPDDILTYYKDLKGKITKIYVTLESGSGKIDYLTKEDDVIKVVSIGGVEYDCSYGVNLNSDNKRLAPGMYVTIYFDRYGKISDMEAMAFEGELGVLVDHRRADGLDGSYYVKIFGANSRFSTFKLAKKIKVNDTTSVKAEDFLSKCGMESANGKIKRQVVKYSTNISGELNAIILADARLTSTGEYMSDFYIYKDYDGTIEHRYNDVFNNFDLQLHPISSTVTFVIPSEENRDLDDAYRIGYDFADGEWSAFIAYGDNPNSPSPIAILKTTADITSGVMMHYQYLFAVERIRRRVDEKGDEIAELVGWYKYAAGTPGKLGSLQIEDIDAIKTQLGGNLPEAGDLVYYGLNASGKIAKLEYVFDKSEEKFIGSYAGNPNLEYNVTGSRFVYGDVTYYDGECLKIEIVSDSGEVREETYPVSRFVESAPTFVKPNPRENGYFTKTTYSNFYDRYSYGSECSRAIVYTQGKYWICGFIFND